MSVRVVGSRFGATRGTLVSAWSAVFSNVKIWWVSCCKPCCADAASEAWLPIWVVSVDCSEMDLGHLGLHQTLSLDVVHNAVHQLPCFCHSHTWVQCERKLNKVRVRTGYEFTGSFVSLRSSFLLNELLGGSSWYRSCLEHFCRLIQFERGDVEGDVQYSHHNIATAIIYREQS